MTEQGIDVLALGPTDNCRYLLGFSPFPDERACVLLVSRTESAFVVPSINAEDVRRASGDIPLFLWDDGDGPGSALSAALAHVRHPEASRIAVDPEMRTDVFLELQSLSRDAVHVDGSVVLRPARAVKAEEELELLRASAAAADAAMRSALERCRPGATENDVAEAAVRGFREAGVMQINFTIVASGPNGAFPHHHTGDRVIEAGDAVVVDLGGRREGYSSDITRMAYIGEPSARYQRVHDVVNRAVEAALAEARIGVAAGAVDAAARQVIADEGFGDSFVHRTGHGLGLSMHEPPWIVPGSVEPLAENMVFSIEPGVYLPGEFGVRLEEIVYLTRDGPARLSALTRDLYVQADP